MVAHVKIKNRNIKYCWVYCVRVYNEQELAKKEAEDATKRTSQVQVTVRQKSEPIMLKDVTITALV
jgi:macrodomain Ter protein organizer (MatP/YcbG family)